MRKLVLALTAAALVAVPAAHAAIERVKVKDNFFKPDRVVIQKGDKVRWVWRGDDVHNVALKRPGSSKITARSAFKTEGRYTFKFRRVGKWRVLCETHPDEMRMRVIVRRP